MNPITYSPAIASLQGLCGATAVNHMVSLAIGGTNDPSSLAPVCRQRREVHGGETVYRAGL